MMILGDKLQEAGLISKEEVDKIKKQMQPKPRPKPDIDSRRLGDLKRVDDIASGITNEQVNTVVQLLGVGSGPLMDRFLTAILYVEDSIKADEISLYVEAYRLKINFLSQNTDGMVQLLFGGK